MEATTPMTPTALRRTRRRLRSLLDHTIGIMRLLAPECTRYHDVGYASLRHREGPPVRVYTRALRRNGRDFAQSIGAEPGLLVAVFSAEAAALEHAVSCNLAAI